MSANSITGISSCELCGQFARVRVLEGYSAGQPVFRGFCLRCAAAESPALPVRPPPRRRLALPKLVALLGVALGTIGVLGDFVPETHPGFGWHQQLGVSVGALLVFVGLLSRADIVALGGGLLFIVALCADWLGFARAPGIGWKHQLVLWLAAVCVLFAVACHYAVALLRARAAARQRERSTGADGGQAAARAALSRGGGAATWGSVE